MFQSLYEVRATVPVQLTAKNGASLTVVRSTFATLPWPGIYVYNVTRNRKYLNHSFDGNCKIASKIQSWTKRLARF